MKCLQGHLPLRVFCDALPALRGPVHRAVREHSSSPCQLQRSERNTDETRRISNVANGKEDKPAKTA